MSTNTSTALIRQVTADHAAMWDARQAEMARYRNAYMTRFFAGQKGSADQIRVETADAYAFIEGYVSSLFTKDPAVLAFRDHSDDGDPELVQACANRFFNRQRASLENATRMALIYPMSFCKLAPRESEDLLNRVAIRAIQPWNVILDTDADSWDEQRFVGHKYFMPVSDAVARFGACDWMPVEKVSYFNETKAKTAKSYENKTTKLPDEYLYIEVVEFYDMVQDKLQFWSPNLRDTNTLLDEEAIPVRTYDDRPLSAIVPLYYGSAPDAPLEGYSAMSRNYDLYFEKNILRSHWANAIRRDSRQFLYRKDVIEEEALAKITAGEDGAMIGVDGDSLDGIVKAIDVGTMSSNYDRYSAAIEADMSRGSLQAPFTKGEATKATATEVTALVHYGASEIGKLARERDGMISRLANLYVRMVLVLVEEGETATIEVKRKPLILTADSLDGRFMYMPLDQAGTPLANSYKQQQLLSLLPVLTQMGIPLPAIRDELLSLFDLPDSFREAAEAEENKRIASPPGTEMPEGQATGKTSPEELAAALAGGQ